MNSHGQATLQEHTGSKFEMDEQLSWLCRKLQFCAKMDSDMDKAPIIRGGQSVRIMVTK
jgi:hypothetical protein